MIKISSFQCQILYFELNEDIKGIYLNHAYLYILILNQVLYTFASL